MTRFDAICLAQDFIPRASGAFALAVWPLLGKSDWGILAMDMRNGDTRYILDDADATRFREILESKQ